MRITKAFLLKQRVSGEPPCEDQVELFAATFPRGAELTEANAVKALAAGLDIHWLADAVLTAEKLAEYSLQCYAAYLEYHRQREAAEHPRQHAPLLAKCRRRYERQCGRAFIKAVQS